MAIKNSPNETVEMSESLKAALVRPPNTAHTETPTLGPREQNWASEDKPYMTVRNGHEIATAEKPDIEAMGHVKGKGEGSVSGGDVKADIELGKIPAAGENESERVK